MSVSGRFAPPWLKNGRDQPITETSVFALSHQVSELESQCTLLKSEKDVLEHRLEVASKKVEEIKQEMRDMENLYSSHNTRAVTQLDENKALQKLKQMEFSVDLTKQKCEKAEARVKELETENRQLRGADVRNGALSEERDNLKQQVLWPLLRKVSFFCIC